MRNLLVIFENSTSKTHSMSKRYGSLADLRPIFCLRTGMQALWQRLKGLFPGFDLQFICRPEVAHVCLRETGLAPNHIESRSYERIIFIDASARPSADFISELLQIGHSQSFSSAGRIVAVALVGKETELASSVAEALSPKATDSSTVSELPFDKLQSSKVDVRRYEYIWDLMLANPENLCEDYDQALSDLGASSEFNLAERLEGSKIIGVGQVFIHPTATVLPGVVFDSTSGPIYIDEGVHIEPTTYIVGPFYAGINCKLLGGKLAGASLGPVCQIAGELEESVLQGYVNKHHAGFIGHSYIGEWVNFGAMTTNSDLKNNYSSVRVDIDNELLDSNSNKIGSFIGDHTKFGIGTLLNTGINIGIFCNIFGGTLIADKSVPSYSWGKGGSWDKHDVEKALQTAKRAMVRRQRELSEDDIKLIRSLSP